MKAFLTMLGPVAWLAIAAGLQMAGALLFFKTTPDPVLITAYILITFGIYFVNRFTDCEDGFNWPEQRMFFQARSKLLTIPVIILSSSIIILSTSKRLSFWHIVLIAAGILYSVKLIPQWKNHSLHFIRLKDILFIKNISVSLLWGITPFAIAAGQTSSSMPSSADLAVVILAFCSTTLISTTSCDVRDITGDRHVGVTTVATKFGKWHTGSYLLCIGLVTSIVIGLIGATGFAQRSSCLLFIGTMLWTAIAVLPVYIENVRIPRTFVDPLIDSQAIACGIGLITLSLFFVA